MIESAAPLLRLTATLVAQYFGFRCERQLRYELVPERLRTGEIPRRNLDPAQGPIVGPRPGAGLLTRAGRQWERRRIRHLIERFGPEAVLCAGWTEQGEARRLPYVEVVAALREPGELRLLVQPELRLPDAAAFAARFGLDTEQVRIVPGQPDLIHIRRLRDGTRRFQVIDIKASPAATIAHQAQVAFYTLLLEQICRDEGIEGGAPELRFGRVWARNGKGPQRFALGAYRHHVRQFLREVLPRAATRTASESSWHLSAACAGCGFFHHCREEADRTDDLSRVVGITPLAKQVLREKQVRTVKELVAASVRRGTFAGCHSLEAGAERLQKRAQATQYGKLFPLESRTHLLAPHEDVRVIVSAEGDPVTGICFALGLRSWPPRSEEVFLAAAGTGLAERAMLCSFLARLDALLAAVDVENRGAGDGRRRTLHLYLWDRTELELLRALLERHLEDVEIQPAIGRLLRVATPRRALPEPEVLRNSLGTVLADAVGALFALPIPYSYDLASVSGRLQPEDAPWVHRPRTDYGWPLSSQVAFERIHNVWHHRSHRTRQGEQTPQEVREEILRTITSKLAAVDSVLRAVRERARASARRGDSLQLHKEPFFLGQEEEQLPDATLETLRIFARLESAAAALALRELHLLPSAERARRGECIPSLNLVERREDGTLVFASDVEWRDAKFRPGDFNLLLTNDDSESLVALHRRGWE
ncbi:MAG TPA: PD-(D/E)XK nuclease family protein, partial [Longimicrobiaceae bacterium]|nr:PD-(D/E)XK nuclease family protein [Longimicrobiaceae bacterium]